MAWAISGGMVFAATDFPTCLSAEAADADDVDATDAADAADAADALLSCC